MAAASVLIHALHRRANIPTVSRRKPPPDDPDAAHQRSALSQRLGDISAAITTGAMTRVAAAQALLDEVDPTALSSELVVEVLRAHDAYPEKSAMRTLMSDAERTLLLARIYETAGLLEFAELLDTVAQRVAAAREQLD